MYAVLIKRKMY